jgi:hypothetical protein
VIIVSSRYRENLLTLLKPLVVQRDHIRVRGKSVRIHPTTIFEIFKEILNGLTLVDFAPQLIMRNYKRPCVYHQRFLVPPYNDRSYHVLLVRIVPMVVYAGNTPIGFSQAFQMRLTPRTFTKVEITCLSIDH